MILVSSTARPWRLLPLLGWVLALTAAAGATSPRPRTASRERGPRATILRAGSPRANERQGWILPDPTSPGLRDEADQADEERRSAPDALTIIATAPAGLAAPRAIVVAAPGAGPAPGRPSAVGPYAGRAPPFA